MTPKISVCIPVYNVEYYIRQCIESVLSQTFQDFEVIIVNDNTPDNSMRIIESFQEKDSRIKVYNNPQNMGLMWTRREGYRHALGDYVVFLDSDDVLPKDSLYVLYDAITTQKADIVCGQIAYISSTGTSLNKYPNMLRYGEDSKSAMKSTLRWEITHNLCGKIFKRELLVSHDYVTYEQVVNAEDALLFYQLLEHANKVTTVSDIVYNYYMYDDSSTNVLLNNKALNGIFLWQKHRWDLITRKFPDLLEELKQSMIAYLTSLSPSLSSANLVNEYLCNYQVPFKVNLASIIKYSTNHTLIKNLLSYYFSPIVRKIRFRRIKGRNPNKLSSKLWLTFAQLPMPGRWRYRFVKCGGVKFNLPAEKPHVVFIGRNVSFDSMYPEQIEISNYAHITDGCVLLTHVLSVDKEDIHWTKGRIVIKEHAFLGARTIITKSVTIGEHSVVGAGSVVTKDIPPYQIWAGNPARFIKNIE